MDTETQEKTEMGTKPVAEHAWPQKLVGEWTTVAEFAMEPGGPIVKAEGRESVRSLGGLWAVGEGKTTMPDGDVMEMVSTLGYDVSFKEYRGCWLASMSSHLWKYVGTLSEDGKTMTLACDGPSMTEDGKTVPYRDVIELIDADTRTLTSFFTDEKGEWQQMMKVTYRRV